MNTAHRLQLRRWRRDPGMIEVMVELSIDVDRIARLLGDKALNNRSGKSFALWGCVKATVREVRS